jgi:hypothetical protein
MKRIGTFLTMLLLALLGWRTALAQTCAAPTNVHVSGIAIVPATPTTPSTASAVVSFTPSPSAVSYTVRYYWIGDSTAAGMLTVNTTSSPVTLTGLRTGPGAFYRVAVMSNCAGGLTTASPWLTVNTSGPAAASCGMVTGVFGAGTTSTASLFFTPVFGALSYTIRYHVVGDTIWHTTTITNAPLALTGLAPGTQLQATIVTNCANGASSAPVSGFFSSAALPFVCPAVSNVQVTNVTDTTAVVSFTPVAGITSYRVRVYPSGLGGQFDAVVSGSPVLVTGLSRNRLYIADVFANCTATATSAPVRATFTTANANPIVCGAVTNVTVTATSSSTATLSFTPGAGNIRFAVLYSSVVGDSSWVSTNSSSVTLTNLVPGRTYTIRVIGFCGVGSNATTTNNAPVAYSFRGALASRSALGNGLVSLFPNPAHHAAEVVLPALARTAQAQLTLLNAVGQQVLTKTVSLASGSETRTQLDLTGVAPGLYTLRVAAGGQSASQRLAIE